MEKNQWLFPPSVAEAKEYQKLLAEKVNVEDQFSMPVRYIAGLDVSNNRFDPKQMVYASAVVLSYPDLKVVECATHAEKQPFPYVSGLLGFREAPALLQAIKKLSIRPDLFFVDGHGISHPRGLGIASHLGVLLDIPTIGVAKSILVGSPQGILSEEAGSKIPLAWKGRVLATLLRTKKKCLPLIVSAGHRISMSSAVTWVENCTQKYRLAEPIRHAHLAANACRLRG